ncbi:MAG: DUF932 domain-containing protein [Lachnospiraceae bacterium]|nr:DUF932 domain-containing protein [Lachnospiraceae bacterium]
MSAQVESMFYVRNTPWHGLGTRVEEALSAMEALQKAGLDWRVIQKPLETFDGIHVPGYAANVRETDQKVLGVVSTQYSVVQNEDAFAFTNEMLGKGVRYETAGSLAGGRRVWILAKLPNQYIVKGDRISPYLVFSNTHDGSGSIKVALTPIRVVCNNTLCLALNTAQRSWSTKHTGDIGGRLEDAKETLFRAEDYMDQLSKEIEKLNTIYIPREQAEKIVGQLLPIPDKASCQQEKNILGQRQDIMNRYLYAPDLKNLSENGYRLLNAVSDFAGHAKPLRVTSTYQDNLFAKTIDGNPVIDRSYQMIKAAA